MYFFINILFIFLYIIISNLYFASKDNFTYIKIAINYLIVLFIFIIFSIKFNYLNFNQSFNVLCLIMNIMFFISYILIIGIKFINSPSYYIINYLRENNPCEKKNVLLYLEEKRIVEERIEILLNNKLIISQNDIIRLNNNGIIFCKTFLLIKNFLGIKSEG